ncbi:MAG: type VI secretion system lipoprotein TssJ [Candidatus Thiodiazotropha sp. (ex Lucina aurantia)]|uniref:Type VI secretion lipoprotein n=2 Tax=Candidatus Thiodiazotropha TaxID=1913444 RepID=A0A7Z1AER9_9GAMM|nr:type VI secretion system lipoprotein TssJ [Candidatus Thiodiazotropha endolucinida]MBT3011936.1 type VI secretion system lipoprotein TssJ [Candidatus Thiodiazotropha sp. (ex Lucina pensylvanica)]MBT3015716.1 type VI secretion system lipoprotein TssJ [Candidatus Thiodiazotropha taylori]MBT3039551.1 type VI secretion system lipoprotein TssJ [Candidatus Thiodiazotropha sp. (ex Codakia orbicularis)]MBV2103425.1 type VI secretion system lipoprotein TssJ [Candidatus Thiodiazotropha sp. (ex Lucina 
MKSIIRNLLHIFALLYLAMVMGCSSVSSVAVTMSAAQSVNPDINDRPSPIVARIYELKSLSVFNNADFFNLFEQDVALLGDEMLMRDELHFQPGEVKLLERELQPDTRYVGVIGAYRDIENATWRRSIEINLHDETTFVIEFGKSGITLQKKSK